MGRAVNKLCSSDANQSEGGFFDFVGCPIGWAEFGFYFTAR